MAQYQHLPIYKVTYDLLVKTTEVTQGINFVGYVVRPHARYLRRRTLATAHYRLRHLPADPATARQSLNSYLGLLRHTDGWRQRQALAHAARAHGLRINTALTKALLPAPTHRADRLVIA